MELFVRKLALTSTFRLPTSSIRSPKGGQSGAFVRLLNQISVAAVMVLCGARGVLAEPPQLVTDINTHSAGGQIDTMASGGSYALISMFDPATGFELYSTDGTTAGTVLLRDINPGVAGSSPYGFTRSGNRVFFGADDGVSGNELWVTDGTSANTKLVRDIVPGIQGSNPSSFAEVGTLLVVGGFAGGGSSSTRRPLLREGSLGSQTATPSRSF